MVVIRNQFYPGHRPPPQPTEEILHGSLLDQILAFCRAKKISQKAFERAVEYPGLFARLEKGTIPRPATVRRLCSFMRWPR